MTNRDKSRTVAMVVLFGALAMCWGQILLTRPPAPAVKRGPRVLTLSENGQVHVFVDGKEYVEKDRVIEPREVWCGREVK